MSIFQLDTSDPDYLQCGVTKILRASGHVTAPAIDHMSVTVRDGALTSDENQHYVMSVLKKGKVPPLPDLFTVFLRIPYYKVYKIDLCLNS